MKKHIPAPAKNASNISNTLKSFLKVHINNAVIISAAISTIYFLSFNTLNELDSISIFSSFIPVISQYLLLLLLLYTSFHFNFFCSRPIPLLYYFLNIPS